MQLDRCMNETNVMKESTHHKTYFLPVHGQLRIHDQLMSAPYRRERRCLRFSTRICSAFHLVFRYLATIVRASYLCAASLSTRRGHFEVQRCTSMYFAFRCTSLFARITINTRTHARTHARVRTNARAHTHTHARTQSRRHARTPHTHPHTHARIRTHAYARTRTRMCARAHTPTHRTSQ